MENQVKEKVLDLVKALSSEKDLVKIKMEVNPNKVCIIKADYLKDNSLDVKVFVFKIDGTEISRDTLYSVASRYF